MNKCAECWVKGVEVNYVGNDISTGPNPNGIGADPVQINWGWHDEIRDNYFTNAYIHTSGSSDDAISLLCKSTSVLVENNITERMHYGIILSWGVAGNVIAYNYSQGNVDQGAQNLVTASFNHHGAHPQFNLWEGNEGFQFYADSVWGTSSHDTVFRNFFTGTTKACNPLTGRASVTCTGSNGWMVYQASRAMQIAQTATAYNIIGDVVSSVAQANLLTNGTGPSHIPQTSTLVWPSTRGYDTVSYDYTFGYGELSDDGSGAGDTALPFQSSLLHGDYSNISGSINWASGLTHTLPASFYQPSQPTWWGSLPYPSIGPDVTGGTGPGGHSSLTASNPAQNCYINVMHGTEGGAGTPLSFNAATCYAGSTPPTPPAPAGPMFVKFSRKDTNEIPISSIRTLALFRSSYVPDKP
jgi:hypothetical protein